MNWIAKWIWIDGEPRPRNYHLCARKVFTCSSAAEGRLHISADSRYRLYLNGEWLGDGPARSWRDLQQFDTYDISGSLKMGENVLAVLVQHFGEGTFHYEIGRGGLLAQVEADGHVLAATDATWKVLPHESYERHTLRISCQMPFEEQYDATHEPGNWTARAFNDTPWADAVEIGTVGVAPWTTLQPRTIPFLTREPAYPVELPEIRVVNPPNIDSSFHIKPYLFPGDLASNPRDVDITVVTIVDSPAAQEITVLPTQSVGWSGTYFLNGKPLEQVPSALWVTPWKVNVGRLRKGGNVLAYRTKGKSHTFDISLCGATAKPVRLRSPHGGAVWSVFAGHADLDAIARCAKAEDLGKYLLDGRMVEHQHMAHTSVFNVTTWAMDTHDEPRVASPDACLSDQADVTIIEPARKGDTELLLDFGRELIGFVEFDLEAEEGTIIDGNLFEGIEKVGRHYTLGNLNSFRYVTKHGRQQFRSFWRRGFRYMTLTFRKHKKPVKLHWVRCLMTTYPSVERGSFRCNDERLNRIWEMGRYTLRMCSEDTFTDCPTYEGTYWVGDARNEALINYAAYGDEPLTARCVVLPVHSLHRSPLTESQVPSGWQNVLTAWSLLWVMMAEEHYRWSGNLATLRQAWPGVIGNIRACRKMLDKRGLLSIDTWNMFDWAPQDAGHKLVTHNQMFLVGALKSGEAVANALGKKADAAMCREFRIRLIKAINQHLWDDKRKAYIDSIHNDGARSTVLSQQTNSLALLYGVAPPERAKHIASWPVAVPEGVVKVGSPFALFFILEALAAGGRHDEILRITRERWGAMLDAGATTCWETFPGWEHTFVSRSLCHAWSAGPTYFLSRYQLGVEPLEPGYARAAVRPVPGDLAWCTGNAPTPRGKIAVSWKREPKAFEIEVTPPATVAVEIELPVSAAKFAKLLIDGQSKRPAGLKVAKKQDRWYVSAPEGRHVTVRAEK